jgi:hypothetical protein
MAHNYSTKDFFRHMPNALLARYFAGRAVFGEFAFAAMSETRHDELFAAWLALPEAQRNTSAITRAPWPLIWTTTRFGVVPATFIMQTPLALKQAQEPAAQRGISGHLQHPGAGQPHPRLLSPHRGPGNNCVVEPFRRGDLDYFFAYPEDYSQQSPEWVNGQFDIRPHNPAFEVIFVYSQPEGSLDLNYRGSFKAIEPLQAMLAETILQLPELPPDLDRIRARNGESVTVSTEELSQWPTEAVAELKSLGLLLKAHSAKSVNYPGCEQDCSMTVQAPTRATRPAPSSAKQESSIPRS